MLDPNSSKQFKWKSIGTHCITFIFLAFKPYLWYLGWSLNKNEEESKNKIEHE